MAKVPVGRSISHAYEFLFGRFFQIVGTAWLPATLYGVGYYVVLSNAQAWVNVADAASVGRAVGILLGTLLVATLIHAVIAISLTQEALGIRKDLTLAHLVVGPRELRLLFGLLLFLVLFAVLYAVVLAVVFGLMFSARKYGAGFAPNLALHGTPVAVVAAAVTAVVLVAWFWLSMLRLLFLLAPVASVENRLRLVRAWELTRGSTLRIFAVLVVVFLPVAVAVWAANRFALHIGPLMPMAAHTKPADVLAHILQFYSANAAALALMSGVLVVLNGALLAGASSAAYRTVTDHQEPESEDDSALVEPLLVAEEPQIAGAGHEAREHVVPAEEAASGAHDELSHPSGDHPDHAPDVHGAPHHGQVTEDVLSNADEHVVIEHHDGHGQVNNDDHGVGHADQHHQADHATNSHGDGHASDHHAGDGHAHGEAGPSHHAASPSGAPDPASIDSEPEAEAA